MTTALLIGRFQPVHKGHVHAIKEAKRKFDKVIVAVGSTNRVNAENPFTFSERKKMLQLAVKGVDVVSIRDWEDDEKWAKRLTNKVKFDVVISGSSWVKKCFPGKKVVEPDWLEPEKYNGILIREEMYYDKPWENLVPRRVVNYLRKIDGVKRVKDLSMVG